MKCRVHKQLPKSDKKGMVGAITVMDVKQGRTAMLFNGLSCLAQIMNPEILFVNMNGMMLRGHEPTGFDKHGRATSKYQEWFCAFLKEGL